MKYAEVAVDAPLGVDRTLTYSLPVRLQAIPGQMVWAPLGPRPVQGVVFEITDTPQVESPRPIISTIQPASLVPPWGLALARWMSRYYLSSLFEAVSLLLPPGFKDRVDAYLEPTGAASASLSDVDKAVMHYVVSRGRVPEREVKKEMGRGAASSISRLVRREFLRRVWELPQSRRAPRYESFLLPNPSDKDSLGESNPLARRAPKQAALLDAALQPPHRLTRSHATREYGASAVRGLIEKGLLAQEWIRQDATKEIPRSDDKGPPLTLTPEQNRAISYVRSTLDGHGKAPRSILLHGVTGSGKTEVYLQALEHCVSLGRQGILLVPEISLTPQMVHRVNARFPGRVVLLHSRLSLREQFDSWWRIREGAYDVVVGPRSALFCPLPNLGLIVVDEEHEWTYKEQDRQPRYHAREVAQRLSRLSGAPLLMGSATPDVVTYYHARRGRHRLFNLPYRIGPASGPSSGQKSDAGLAKVEIQDMRQELKEGNRSPFSRRLTQAMRDCVARGEQAILFLNRRGAATLVQCRDCGEAVQCRRCSVSLTYHRTRGLLCHLCNRRGKTPSRCEGCGSSRIRYMGLGTQRVVEDLEQLVPGAGVMRLDSDAARKAGEHGDILNAFSEGQAQVLVGTQMVAKGLHVPKVSLVGVILADIGLYRPDFRAGERTFQLLCQVAGRAGRGHTPGLVIIQTYNPDSYPVQAAGRQDYNGLYKREIAYRRELRNPPFSRLVHMVYLHKNEAACQEEARRMAEILRSTAYGRGFSGIDIIGPAPAHPRRLRGRYRWHLIIRGGSLHELLAAVPIPKGWTVDIDPVSVL